MKKILRSLENVNHNDHFSFEMSSSNFMLFYSSAWEISDSDRQTGWI